jgi:putative salt-induced outer membrane protein
MKNLVIACALALSSVAQAQEWKGVGEFGLAITGGNTDTTNINGKLGLVKETEAWKHEFGIGILKASAKQFVLLPVTTTNNGVTVTQFQATQQTVDTANRYDASWTSGYKLSETSYIFGSLRYENDDFLSFDSQSVASLGYGFYPIKDESTTLLFELGAGYRRIDFGNTSEGDAVLRGKMDFNHKLTDTTVIYDTFLIEAGSDNKFMQNDLGLAVKISDAFAVKAGFQIRRNSDVIGVGVKKTDRLFTTNLVYSF